MISIGGKYTYVWFIQNAVRSSDYIGLNDRLVINELERMWKEAVMA
jgi:hypothetical protein